MVNALVYEVRSFISRFYLLTSAYCKSSTGEKVELSYWLDSLLASFSRPSGHMVSVTRNVLRNGGRLVVLSSIRTLLIACCCTAYSIKITRSAVINMEKFTSEELWSSGPQTSDLLPKCEACRP